MLPIFGIQIPALLRDFHVFHMYKEHPVFNPPPSDAVLWRYMDFTKFVSLLEKQALFFARADRLGDPFEGSFSKVNKVLRPSFVQRLYGEEKIPEGTLEHMADHMERTRRSILINCWQRLYGEEKIPEGTLEHMADHMERTRRSILINCWHQSTYESAAMWRLYSREEDGIAIKTDFNSFKNSFTCSQSIYIGSVSYVDYKSFFIPERNDFSRYLHKRKSFEHEHEVRVISSRFPNPDSDDVSMQLYHDRISGAYYEVDLSLLIKKVIVSPFAPDWFLELVKSVTDRYNFRFSVVRSTQADVPTWG